MTRTYPHGYSNGTITEDALLTSSLWSHFDPEYARRLKAVMDFAYDNGHPVGIGGGWRSSDAQLALFLSRYHPAPTGQGVYWRYELPKPEYSLPAGTLVEWWEKNPGVASAAPPGRSYHESTTPDLKCLAADMVGDLKWANPHLADYGLMEFGAINNEQWHWQPLEIPHARIKYLPGLHHPLQVWPLPGDQPPPPIPLPLEDNMQVITPNARVYDSRNSTPFAANEVREVAVTMGGQAVALNITAIGKGLAGFVTVFTGPTPPATSNVNFQASGAIANTAIVDVDNSKVKVTASAPCHVIIDLQAVWP